MNATAPLGLTPHASLCLDKMRAMLAPYIGAKPSPVADRGQVLWTLLTEGERRFLLKAAKLDAPLAAYRWNDLPDAARVDVLAAWARWRDWVRRIDLHLDQLGRGRR